MRVVLQPLVFLCLCLLPLARSKCDPSDLSSWTPEECIIKYCFCVTSSSNCKCNLIGIQSSTFQTLRLLYCLDSICSPSLQALELAGHPEEAVSCNSAISVPNSNCSNLGSILNSASGYSIFLVRFDTSDSLNGTHLVYSILPDTISSVCGATEVPCDADPNFLYNMCDLSPCPDSQPCNRELAHTYSSTQLLSLWSCMRIVRPSRSFSSCAENVSISTEGLCCPFGYAGPTCEVCDVGIFPEDCDGPDAFLQCLNNCTLANNTTHPCCKDLNEETCGRVHAECEYSGDPSNLVPCSTICQDYSSILPQVCNTSLSLCVEPQSLLAGDCGELLEINCSKNFAFCVELCTSVPATPCLEELTAFCTREAFLVQLVRFSRDLTDVSQFVSNAVLSLSLQIPVLYGSNISLCGLVGILNSVMEEEMLLESMDNVQTLLNGTDMTLGNVNAARCEQPSNVQSQASDLLLFLEFSISLIAAQANMTTIFNGTNIFIKVDPLSLSQQNRMDNRFPPNMEDHHLINGIMATAEGELLCGDSERERLVNCSVVVSTAVVRNLAVHLDNDTETVESPAENSSNSHVLIYQLSGVQDLTQRLQTRPLQLAFTPLRNASDHTCVFWDFSIRSWSSENITTMSNSTHTLCYSRHLTSFAILVSVTGEIDVRGLSILSYIGCAMSIVSLIATITILLVFRKSLNKGPLLYIHLNLAIALLLGLIVFVAAVETATPIRWLCTLVAALLHYLFLCVFCWMLAEGIMLYLLVVRVFGMAAEKWYYLLILGWGLPFPLVVVSASVLRDSYGTDRHCWIDAAVDEPAIWLFVGPMVLIILINTVILVATVVAMVKGRKHGGAEQNVKNIQLVKSAIKSTLILLPLLGVTWIIGVLAVNINTIVFATLFIIFNAFQGVFILVLHVLRNDVVLNKTKAMFKRCFKKRLSIKFIGHTTNGTRMSTLDSDSRSTAGRQVKLMHDW